MSEIELPEPASEHYRWLGDPPRREYYYTAEQVRQAVLAERERCARVCDAETEIAHGEFGEGWVEGARTCAAAIRR